MSWMTRSIGIGLVAIAVTVVDAAPHYVATNGKAENDGSAERPWPSVEYALSKAGGGQTIIVKPGIYRGPVQIARQFAGTRERPTVIQSEVKWQAVIVGAEYHVIGKGSAQHAPATDFWGRPRSQGKAPDLGVFPYVSALERSDTRASWDHGWAYHRHGQATNVLPDLWTLP